MRLSNAARQKGWSMSDQMVKWVVGGVLMLHGLGHGGALAALAWIHFRPGTKTGAWSAARAWAMPTLTADIAAVIACAFWVVALVGFVVAALSVWGVFVPADWWRPVGVAAALVSIAGIVVFFGTWPMFNTLAAIGVDVAVLVAVLWLQWPSQATLGR
jgi:hypothetical protein